MLVLPVMQVLDERLPARVWDKISPCPITGCWLWTGTYSGCPQTRWKVGDTWKTVAVRKVITELVLEAPVKVIAELVSESPGDFGIGSDMRECVNPAHYRFGTTAELARQWADANRDVHCVNGHEYAVYGQYVRHTSNGWTIRVCRACHLLRLHAKKVRKNRRRLARMSPANRAAFLVRSDARRKGWDGRRDPALHQLRENAA